MESNTLEQEVVEALRDQAPVRGLPGVRISNVETNPELPFDVAFDLTTGKTRIRVFGDIKSTLTPRSLEQVEPWTRRVKALREDITVAMVSPELSAQSQEFCIQNNIDFIDLVGNVFINIPGRMALQRTGQRGERIAARSLRSYETSIAPISGVNPFSARSSRILRVLLEQPRAWSVTEISKELFSESERLRERYSQSLSITVSLGAISKAIASLEDQLLVRRRGTAVVIPEPERLLTTWARKYQERYRLRLRNSFQISNPFGPSPEEINNGIRNSVRYPYAFTSAFAATFEAPFLDIDVVDVFVAGGADEIDLRRLRFEKSTGPAIRFIRPYDEGVFMYSMTKRGVPVVSDVQAFLDLFARGGRDGKQAEYLLDRTLRQKWGAE